MKRTLWILGIAFVVAGAIFAFSFGVGSHARAAGLSCTSTSCASPDICYFPDTNQSYCALPTGGSAACNYGCCSNANCGTGNTCYNPGTEFAYCSSSAATTATAGPVITGVQGFNPATNAYTNYTAFVNTTLVVYGNFASSANAVTIDNEVMGAYAGTVAPSYQSANQINVPLNNIAIGSHVVKVADSAGTSAPVSFTVTAMPTAGGGNFGGAAQSQSTATTATTAATATTSGSTSNTTASGVEEIVAGTTPSTQALNSNQCFIAAPGSPASNAYEAYVKANPSATAAQLSAMSLAYGVTCEPFSSTSLTSGSTSGYGAFSSQAAYQAFLNSQSPSAQAPILAGTSLELGNFQAGASITVTAANISNQTQILFFAPGADTVISPSQVTVDTITFNLPSNLTPGTYSFNLFNGQSAIKGNFSDSSRVMFLTIVGPGGSTTTSGSTAPPGTIIGPILSGPTGEYQSDINSELSAITAMLAGLSTQVGNTNTGGGTQAGTGTSVSTGSSNSSNTSNSSNQAMQSLCSSLGY